MRFQPFLLVLLVGACAQASPPMEVADGSYIINARAAPARGGTAGAYEKAHTDAQTFCAQQSKRAVLQSAQDRDVYQSAYGGAFSGTPTGGYSGAMSGGTNAWGSATVRFRCV